MRLLAAAAFFGLACAPANALRRVDGSATPIVVVDRVQFDGVALSLRLLIGAESKALAIDRRVVENVHFSIRGVRDCEGRKLRYIVEDYFPGPPSDADVLEIEPGYWFGADLKFVLVPKPVDCAEASFVYWRGLPGTSPSLPMSVRLERAREQVR